ncbi:MAG: hypothetical protein GX649_19880, partial [Chloroflexi bacterium]|nr:hypothetical protein [Chloroflexota bacterium]
SGASAFSWAQLGHSDLGGVTAEQHHALVTAGNAGIGVAGQAVSLALATNPGLEVSSGLQLGTPGGLTASTTNAVMGASHTHAVATGTPGAIQPDDTAAAGTSTDLARADHRHAIAAGTPGSVTLAANAAGVATSFARSDHHHHLDQSIAPTWTGIHTHDGNVLLGASATLKSADWASGVTGWGITPAGAADFRTLAAREIVAQAFVADIEQALAAGQVITKSVVLLAADFQVPAYSGATTVAVEHLPGYPLVDVFTAGDILRLRTITRDGGLAVGDCYVTVGSQVSKDAASQVWNVTRLADPDGGSATAGMVVHRGAVVLDYGQSGDGYWEVTCLDAAGAPYAQVATWDTTPSNATVRARIGQLSGIFSEGPEWGLFAGDHAAGNYLRASGDGLAIHLGDGHIGLDATGITVDGDQDEVNTQTGMRWVSPSTGRRVARLSAGPWGANGFPLVGLYANDLREHENSHVRLKAQGGSSPFTYGDIAMACYSTYTAVGLMAQFAADPLDSHAATLDVVSQNGALWPAHVRISIDTIVQFRVTADNVEVSPPLDLFSSTTWNNGVTLRAKNAAGTAENWMWPRYSDDYMYTNFGAAGWKIRTNASGIVLTFDADGDATFSRTVTSTLGFSGPGVTSGSNPGHTHTAYSLTSHNHSGVYAPAAQGVTNGDAHDHSGGDGAQIDHGALGGRADDDHTQYLLASGARALSANWDAGSYYIRASYFYSDVATGTRPLVCTSTTTCTNLNADLLDGNHASAFATSGHTHTDYVNRAGTTALTGNWDAGSYQIRALTFYSDVATGTKPITVSSTTVCGKLNADLLDGNHASAFATSGHTHT